MRKKIVAGMLIMATLTSVGFSACGNDEDKTPAGDNIQMEQEYENTLTMEGGGMQIGKSEGTIKLMGSSISPSEYVTYGVSPTSETAYTLNATVSPANAASALDWSVAWKNSSVWANGKAVTDYVTVTPVSDGALTAVVECKQAFGEQIKIYAKARNNFAVYADCTVDYEKRIQDVSTLVIGHTDYSGNTITSSNGEWTYTPPGPEIKNTGNVFYALPDVWELGTTDDQMSVVCSMSTGTLEDTYSYSISMCFTEEMERRFTILEENYPDFWGKADITFGRKANEYFSIDEYDGRCGRNFFAYAFDKTIRDYIMSNETAALMGYSKAPVNLGEAYIGLYEEGYIESLTFGYIKLTAVGARTTFEKEFAMRVVPRDYAGYNYL